MQPGSYQVKSASRQFSPAYVVDPPRVVYRWLNDGRGSVLSRFDDAQRALVDYTPSISAKGVVLQGVHATNDQINYPSEPAGRDLS